MAFITTAALNASNPVPIFTGSTFNGNTLAVDGFVKLKSLLKTAGFRVLASADGLTATLGDIFTVLGSYTNFPDTLNDGTMGNPRIATSYANNLAWMVLAPPLASPFQIHICVQQGDNASNAGYWSIKVSCGGFDLTSLSPTVMPGPVTVGDEKKIWGTGTDLAPAGMLAVAVGYRYNIFADPNGDRFWMSSWLNNTNNTNMFFFLDKMLMMATGDTYPFLCGATIDGSVGYMATSGGTIENVGQGAASMFTGGLTTKMTAMAPSMFNEPGVGKYGANTVTGKEDPLPMYWGRPSSAPSAPNGVKGVSSMMGWRGAPHDNADNVSTTGVNTYDWAIVNDAMVPWEKPGVPGLR